VGPPAIERRSPADLLGGLIPHARFTTVVILLINTGLLIGTMLNGPNLYSAGAKYGPFIRAGQWWRLITAGFLHGGLMHYLMNSWVLFDLGAQTEESYGTSRYLVFYFISTVTGFYASYLWSPGSSSVGASAGIFGLIGAMIALGVRDRSAYGRMVRSHYTQWAVYGLLFSLLPNLMPGIFGFALDNAAHLGGLAGGFIVAYLAGTPRFTSPMERFWQIAAGVAVALTAVSFGYMLRWLMASATT
jgi:rhomboid protease GluP